MYIEKCNSVYASEIAAFLNKEIMGEDIIIFGLSDIHNPQNNSAILLASEQEGYKSALKNLVSVVDEVLLISGTRTTKLKQFTYILSDDPFSDYVNIIKHYFSEEVELGYIEKSAQIDDSCILGSGIYVGKNVVVGPNTQIADHTMIFHNTVVFGKVNIGRKCIIKSNSTLGSEGFTYSYDNKRYDEIPQIGGIIIKDNVSIGSNSTVENGIIGNTIIGENVKIDDLVQIGSNSIIGQKSLIAAGTILCRNVTVGENCWIAPGCCIKENIKIGDNSIIGLGSVVLKSVPCNAVVAGVPSKNIK